MKKLFLLFLLLSQFTLSPFAHAQSSSVQNIIEQIDFRTDTVESVYNWVTENVRYDVAKLNAIEKDKGEGKKYNSQQEYNEAMLEKVIVRKKGVCEDYALLFDAIVTELGYPSVIINGMAKDKKGKIDTNVGHAWNAVKVNGKWKLLDATWGAGYVSDKGKFVKEFSSDWYDVEPERMQKDHLPCDPLWQLKENPMTYDDFKNENPTTTSTVSYDIESLTESHYQSSMKERLQAQLDRSEEMGEGFRLIRKWRKRTKENIELGDLIAQPNLLENAIAQCKAAGQTMEDYTKARNRNFKGRKWTKEYAKQALSESRLDLESALVSFKSVDVGDNKFKKQLSRNISNAERMIKFIDSQLDFLNGNGNGGARKTRSKSRRR